MKRIHLFIVVGITFLVYLLGASSPFIYDDWSFITENPYIRTFEGFFRAFENMNVREPSSILNRPFLYFTFTINYFFATLEPTSYRLVNIIIHLLNVILIYYIVSLLLRKDGRDADKSYIPLVVAAMFAFNPIVTGAINVVCRRSTSMATLFYLLSFYLLATSGRVLSLRMLFSVVSLGFAFASKEIAVTFPAVAILYVVLFRRDRKLTENVLAILPTIIVIGIFLTARLYVFGSFTYQSGTSPESQPPNSGYYFLTQFYSIALYFHKILFPFKQYIAYPILEFTSFFHPKIIVSAFFLFSVTGFVFYWVIKKYEFHRLILFGYLWFFIAISPTSSFVPLIEVIAERRVYPGLLGFFLVVVCMLSAGIYKLSDSKKSARTLKQVVTVVFIFYSVFLLGKNVKRQLDYQDVVPLWTALIGEFPVTPKMYAPYNSLGTIYAKKGKIQKSIEYYEIASNLFPYHPDPHYNIARTYYDLRQFDKAIVKYKDAIRLDPYNYKFYNNLAAIYAEREDYFEAERLYKKVVQLYPNDDLAHYNLGDIYRDTGRFQESEREYNIALKITPLRTVVYLKQAKLYYKIKQFGLCANILQKGLQITGPNKEMYLFRGDCLYSLGDINGSLQNYRQALSMDLGPKVRAELVKRIRSMEQGIMPHQP